MLRAVISLMHDIATTPLDLPGINTPTQFPRWYPNQEEAVAFGFYSNARHIGMSIPTGTGKSLTAWMLASLFNHVSGGRAVILTHRKGLAEQYRAVFPNVAEIRGWRNYTDALGRPDREQYREALAIAQMADIVVTTYAYWLTASQYGKGLGPGINTIICDEAHSVLDELSNFLSCSLDEEQCQEWTLDWPDHLTENPYDWASWARNEAVPSLSTMKAESEDAQERLSFLRGRLELVADMQGRWIAHRDRRSVFLAKVWPGDEAERYLYRDAEHVVSLSATLRPRTLDLIGAGDDRAFNEWGHPYPWEIRPVYYIPTIRATEKHASRLDWGNWVARIDQIIDRWPEHLGLVHTVSYPRAQMFMRESVYGGQDGLLRTHGTHTTERAVEEFRMSEPPGVLVSPVLVAGWDLPEVTWQVIGKVPWPPAKDPLVKARSEDDADYVFYDIGQKIVQTAGRIVRGPDPEDFGVTYLIDNTWKWMGPKLRTAGFLPKWFYVENRNAIPR